MNLVLLVWLLVVVVLLRPSFPALRAGERSEPARSAGKEDFIQCLRVLKCISCGVAMPKAVCGRRWLYKWIPPSVACLASRWFLKFASNQYSCFKIPLTRSARAFSAL